MPLNGAPLFVSIRSYETNSVYTIQTFEYATADSAVDTNVTDSGSVMINPVVGSVLDDQLTTVEWLADARANRFLFKVGTTPGGYDLQSLWLNQNARSAAVNGAT